MEKLKPTADCIVARLVPSWGSIVSLLFKATEPYEHYYDEHGEEVPYGAIASWTDVELPPENESEDEKIKKTAIKILKGVAHKVFKHEGVSKESVLAYLEKQQEPADGDFARGYDCGYECCLHSHGAEWFEKQKEQKPAEWSDNFEENIRNLLQEKLKWTSNDGSMYSAVFIDDKTLKDIISGIWFYVGKEALKYPNKQLNVEQKPVSGSSEKPNNHKEWSEEDESAFEDLIWCIEQARKSAKDENDMGNIWYAENWLKERLKSLRPQPHWKPSEEQMDALNEIINTLAASKHPHESDYLFNILNGLRKNLKNL